MANGRFILFGSTRSDKISRAVASISSYLIPCSTVEEASDVCESGSIAVMPIKASDMMLAMRGGFTCYAITDEATDAECSVISAVGITSFPSIPAEELGISECIRWSITVRIQELLLNRDYLRFATGLSLILTDREVVSEDYPTAVVHHYDDPVQLAQDVSCGKLEAHRVHIVVARLSNPRVFLELSTLCIAVATECDVVALARTVRCKFHCDGCVPISTQWVSSIDLAMTLAAAKRHQLIAEIVTLRMSNAQFERLSKKFPGVLVREKEPVNPLFPHVVVSHSKPHILKEEEELVVLNSIRLFPVFQDQTGFFLLPPCQMYNGRPREDYDRHSLVSHKASPLDVVYSRIYKPPAVRVVAESYSFTTLTDEAWRESPFEGCPLCLSLFKSK